MALIGVGTGDSQHESQWLASKVSYLLLSSSKVFPVPPSMPSYGIRCRYSSTDFSTTRLFGPFSSPFPLQILGMKLFPEDKDGESWGWKYNVAEAGYEVLCISQFTLMANLRKGSKPDFHDAMVRSFLCVS